jgi:hypothetical protein
VHTLFTALHHQSALLVLLLDTLMRRGILSPSAIVDVLVSSKYPLVGHLHLQCLHSNQWVWKLIEISTDRCLDIMKAAVSIQNNEAYKQYQQQDTSMDTGNEMSEQMAITIQIPEVILEAVDAAAETCRELYSLLVSQLLHQLHLRHELLVTNGQESATSVTTGKLSSLDCHLVSYVSVLNRLMRSFKLVEKGLQVSAVQGTLVPALMSAVDVSKHLLTLFGMNETSIDTDANNEEEVIAQAMRRLTGPAKRMWQTSS